MPPPTGRRNAKRTRGCPENAISQHNQPKIQRRLGIKIIRFIPVCIHKPVATLKHFIGIHAVVCFIGCIHARCSQMPEQKKKGTKGNYNQCRFSNEFCAMLLCIHLLSPASILSAAIRLYRKTFGPFSCAAFFIAAYASGFPTISSNTPRISSSESSFKNRTLPLRST